MAQLKVQNTSRLNWLLIAVSDAEFEDRQATGEWSDAAPHVLLAPLCSDSLLVSQHKRLVFSIEAINDVSPLESSQFSLLNTTGTPLRVQEELLNGEKWVRGRVELLAPGQSCAAILLSDKSRAVAVGVTS